MTVPGKSILFVYPGEESEHKVIMIGKAQDSYLGILWNLYANHCLIITLKNDRCSDATNRIKVKGVMFPEVQPHLL